MFKVRNIFVHKKNLSSKQNFMLNEKSRFFLYLDHPIASKFNVMTNLCREIARNLWLSIWILIYGSTTNGPIHDWAHTIEPTRLCPHTIMPRHDCAQTRLCPHTFVHTHDEYTRLLHQCINDTNVPRHVCAQTRLCPDTIVPRHDCAHTRFCPDTFVPTHICAHTRLCPDTFVPWYVIPFLTFLSFICAGATSVNFKILVRSCQNVLYELW